MGIFTDSVEQEDTDDAWEQQYTEGEVKGGGLIILLLILMYLWKFTTTE